MNLYDAAMLALAYGRGVRRPTMPEGLVIVPVAADPRDDEGIRPMKAFLVAPGTDSRQPDWAAEIDDLVADDWITADWRAMVRKPLAGYV